jgi:hypothetical protein
MIYRFLLLLCLSLVTFSSVQAQSLKRKYYGTYEGQIGAYKFDAGELLVEVEAVPIQIEINSGFLTIQIGKLVTRGNFEILFEADEYYVLDAKMENQYVGERIVIYKKGKKISRDGLFPQPSTLLFQN